MAEVIFNKLEKVYSNGFKAVHGIDLKIADGEFMVIVGPSGCAKSTTLRMLAGLETISGGEVRIGDKIVNNLAPKSRGIAMVFQNYALYPHMTVRENLAFGLKLSKLPKAQIDRQVEEAAKILELEELLDRLPRQLSGGQAQRVAVGRAIVKKPDVFLFDEPLSNLDAKLRASMRIRISDLHKQLKKSGKPATTVYVTHDQEEAMSISDTIAVMNAGKIQHIGTPRDIYQRPANTFVATFIGRTNILDARMEQGTLVFPTGERFTRDSWRTIPDGPVKVSVRPEEFVVHHADEKAGGLSAVLEDSVYLGLNTHYYLKLTGGASVELIQESAIDEKLEPGSAVTLTLKEEKINIFSEDGTKNYLRV
ncbi:MAG TPA: sugar ABC transporter ATP-binding protein [Klebsiella pneumoniae]|nr:sugar ABC transporter ATP-binding protein [Klebsiella pneumoniae]